MKLIGVNLIWGFNFLLGSIIAIGFRQAFKLLKKWNIMHRELTNNNLLDRISGFMFDIMIIAGVAAIDLSQLSTMVIPIIIICTLGTVFTFIYIRKATRLLYPGYEDEMFFAMFGMLTGTASNGMILLREIDPNFETPASSNLVLQQLPAIVFGAPLLLSIGFVEDLNTTLIIFGVVIAMFIAYNIILLRKFIFKNKKIKQ